jgi:hypothetical protein
LPIGIFGLGPQLGHTDKSPSHRVIGAVAADVEVDEPVQTESCEFDDRVWLDVAGKHRLHHVGHAPQRLQGGPRARESVAALSQDRWPPQKAYVVDGLLSMGGGSPWRWTIFHSPFSLR